MAKTDSDDLRCFLCGRMGRLETHHMLHGSRRRLADIYKLTVRLCPACHRELHDHGLHDADLQELAQIWFEEEHGHDEFMRLFGKNYRRDIDE